LKKAEVLKHLVNKSFEQSVPENRNADGPFKAAGSGPVGHFFSRAFLLNALGKN